MLEVRKPIKDYEDLYEVSNLGNVRNFKNKVLKKQNTNSNGYYRVSLWKNNKPKNIFVHRLVAEAFIPNPSNLSCVNHLNMNRKDNNVQNLEFCTQKENIEYATLHSKEFQKRKRPIYQYDLNNIFLKKYKTVKEASKINKISDGNICASCKGKRKQAGGFIWRYENEC